MKIRLVESQWHSIQCDALLIPIFDDDDFGSDLPGEIDRRLDGLLTELRDNDEWTGKSGHLSVIHRPASLPVGRLILVGAGSKRDYRGNAIRTVVMNAVHKVKASNLARIAVFRRSSLDPALAAQAAVEGVVLGALDIDEYKTSQRSRNRIQEILFAADGDLPTGAVEEAMRRGEILANANNMARSLVNEPGNRISPNLMAERARQVAERVGLEVEILGEPEIVELGMNCILAVARGSDEPARVIVLRHLGGEPQAAPALFVGKGVTFDSGGLSLKPAKSMEEMKTDKAGACAVLAAMHAIAQLQVPRNVIAVIPCVENLPSGRAQRPGDVIRSMSGKTVEVLNTDAEGRLLLADALHYGMRFKPEYIVDLATLTGAVVVALGKHRAGLFCNHDPLRDKILEASEISGEKLWPLPIDDEHRKDLESDIADIKNVGERWGGASVAAAFLREFVQDVPWAHLDIAGVDLYKECTPMKGPTGFGVRTLVELVSLG